MHPSSRLSLLLFGVTVIALAAWLLLAPGRSVAPAPISVDWATVADDPGERLEISYLYTFTREIQPDSVVKAIIEARMNVTLDLEYVPMAVQSVRKPLQLIGGASPDIFMAEAGEIARYQEHGFLLPIPRELLASHCPTLVARMDRYAPWLWPGLEVDGVGYGCPAALWHEARYPRTGAWRKDLLEAVGIQDVPDTLAEFATAFERLHAAGQGCMTGDVSAGGIETAFTEIFCAFGVLPFDWMLRDDEIVYGGIQPGTRDALALLREWYAAGYIHPDFVTDRWWSEARSKFVDGRIAYHNHIGLLDGLELPVLPAVPPVGPDGERGMRVHGMAGGQSPCFGAHLAREPRKVIRVLRMLEALMTDEQFFVETHIGKEGEHWRWRDGAVEQLPPFDSQRERYRHCITDARQMAGATVLSFTGTGPEVYEKYAAPAPYRKAEWGRASVVGRYDVVSATRALGARLRRQQQVLFVDIIKGDTPLADFDRFTDEWRQEGGETLLREVRKHYARQLEITQP